MAPLAWAAVLLLTLAALVPKPAAAVAVAADQEPLSTIYASNPQLTSWSSGDPCSGMYASRMQLHALCHHVLTKLMIACRPAWTAPVSARVVWHYV